MKWQFGWSNTIETSEHSERNTERAAAVAARAAARREAEERSGAMEWLQEMSTGQEASTNPNPNPSTSEIPSWAVVASNVEEQELKEVVWRVRFKDRTPRMDGEGVVEAMLGATKGTANFTVQAIGDLLKFDYNEPWARHFIHRGRGDSTEGKAEWRRAWLRREMRGLVIRRTGEIVMRGLHKFFNIGQLQEINETALSKKIVHEVLEKLDGQMITGIMIGESAQFWSRGGNTMVGTAAERVARESKGDYEALVRDLANTGHTAVFELVGEQSRIKANEGPSPRLVLIAVREQVSGDYATHEQLQSLGEKYGGVEVVRRFSELEVISIGELRKTVFQTWTGREGVVVRFSDGTMVKIKSIWWFKQGATVYMREESKLWQEQEQARQSKFRSKLQTRDQRVAIWGLQGQILAQQIKEVMAKVKKVELVYKADGKLSVVLASFENRCEANEAKENALKEGWRAQQAYSRRTKNLNRRVEVFKY